MRWAICAWPGAAMSSRRSAPPAAHGSECRFLQSRGGLLALASTQAQAPPAARMVSQAWHADVGTLRTAHLVFARPLGRPLTAQGAWATCPPISVPPAAPHGLPFRPTGGAPTASPCAPPAGPPRPPPAPHRRGPHGLPRSVPPRPRAPPVAQARGHHHLAARTAATAPVSRSGERAPPRRGTARWPRGSRRRSRAHARRRRRLRARAPRRSGRLGPRSSSAGREPGRTRRAW